MDKIASPLLQLRFYHRSQKMRKKKYTKSFQIIVSPND